MPKKLKKIVAKPVEPEETAELVVEETVVEEKPTPVEEVVVKEEKKLAKGMVKVKVLVGTLSWEGGKFEKGETFETTLQRAKQFDPKDIKVLKS